MEVGAPAVPVLMPGCVADTRCVQAKQQVLCLALWSSSSSSESSTATTFASA